MITGAFTPADGEADNPHDGKDDRCYPQEVDCESRAKEDQYEQ